MIILKCNNCSAQRKKRNSPLAIHWISLRYLLSKKLAMDIHRALLSRTIQLFLLEPLLKLSVTQPNEPIVNLPKNGKIQRVYSVIYSGFYS